MTPSKPFVSIIIPIRNEANYIERCLNAINGQDYPTESMEVLIADGMSTDKTREILADIQVRSTTINIFDNPDQTVSHALNLALRKAQGDIIIRVDGHTVIAPDYVRKCVETLQRTQAENAGGRMNAVGESYHGDVIAAATSTRFGVGGARFHYSTREEWVDTVYMGAWPKKVFQKAGYFDEEMVRNQDDEFNYRLRKMGGKILLSPEIQSKYYCRSSLRTLWKQYYQYGYWKVRVLQKHPRQMSFRHFVPPAFVAAMVLPLPIALFFPKFAVLFFLPHVFYLFANLLASLFTAYHRGWRYFPLLPAAFAVLHTSYGAGFLVGLVKFIRRWGEQEGSYP